MSGTSSAGGTVGSFMAGDYVVFGLMLLGSAAIGVYYAWKERGSQGTSGDFLMGGRSLTALPVSLSLTASFMSAITVLASPAEVYQFGATFSLIGLSYGSTVLITSEVFLPVFYRLGITSTYEYLELRFNRVTRLLGTVFFIVQTVLYTGIVIYTPALALNQVTGMDLWSAVISTGVVCTFYCTMGGLKAVVWTDVFQVGIMLAGFLCVIIRAVILQGGVQNIITDCELGGRLNFWDFDMNPLRRHTFWTMVCGGTFVWVSVYGINQAQVQRYISCRSITHARAALFMNLIGLWAIMLCSVFAGLCLYSVYKNCDPWTSGRISAPDQLMPYLVMDILRDFPGLPGLFVAAAFSGSLSTVSSSINALAAVTIEDLIKPHTQMSEKHLSWTSKGLTFAYGGVCIGMAGLASLMGSVIQTVISIFGIIGGPLLGLFSLGILCPFANSTGALTGVMSGLALSLWVGLGAQVYPPTAEMTRPLSLSTQGCSFNVTSADNMSTIPTLNPALLTFNTTTWQHNVAVRPLLADSWYSLSYLYFSPIGTITAIIVGLVVSLLSGGTKLKLESGLTLMKEDMYSYHLLKRFMERATRQRCDDVARNGQRKGGNDNPGFRDIELDFANGNVPTS